MNEFRYLLEVNLSLTLLFVLYRFLLERETFFLGNRTFLLMALIVSLVLPFCIVPGLPALFDWSVVDGVVPLRGGGASAVTGIGFRDVVAGLYLAGVAVFAVRFLYRLAAIVFFRARFGGEDRGDYTLVRTGEGTSTFSFFRFLFWSDEAGLSEEQRAMVLRHELAHIRQWHSLDVLLLEVIGIFCWPNPVFYLFRRHLRELHEFLADADASAPVDAGSYERLLATQLIRDSGLPLAQGFAQSRVRRRIEMLRRPRSKRLSALKYVLAIPLLLAVMTLFVTNPPRMVIRTSGLIDVGGPRHGVVPERQKETETSRSREEIGGKRSNERARAERPTDPVSMEPSHAGSVSRAEVGSNDIPEPIVASDALDHLPIPLEPPGEIPGREREFMLFDTAVHKLADIDGERIKAQCVPSYRMLFPEPKERQF